MKTDDFWHEDRTDLLAAAAQRADRQRAEAAKVDPVTVALCGNPNKGLTSGGAS